MAVVWLMGVSTEVSTGVTGGMLMGLGDSVIGSTGTVAGDWMTGRSGASGDGMVMGGRMRGDTGGISWLKGRGGSAVDGRVTVDVEV